MARKKSRGRQVPESQKRQCPHCSIKAKFLGDHIRNQHPDKKGKAPSSITPTASEDFSLSPTTSDAATDDWPDVEKILTPSTKTETRTVTETKIEPDVKGGGEIGGLAEFFMTIADWINSFWDEKPYINLTEATARRLEKQFNQAFKIYITPMIGFIITVAIIFGYPIIAHIIGRDFIYGAIKKFKDGISNRMKERKKHETTGY